MAKDNGKVIISLLAGATAGIVAGLLLAPETGDEARKGVRESAGKWGSFLKSTLAKLQGAPGTNPDAAVSEDRDAADALFNSMSEPGDLSTSATGNGRTIAGDADGGADVDANQGDDASSGDGRTPSM